MIIFITNVPMEMDGFENQPLEMAGFEQTQPPMILK